VSGTRPGFLLLEDGTRFDGFVHGNVDGTTGEVVFTTSMNGYQESVTDPSFNSQIITFTYPLIGNYGVSAKAMESDAAHARGVVMREAKNDVTATDAEKGWLDWLEENGVAAISGVDTRALVRHIRDKGAMRGGIFAGTDIDRAAAAVAAEPDMTGRDLAGEVSPGQPRVIPGSGIHVAAIDTGIKNSIINSLRKYDCRITLLPASASADDIRALEPDLYFLSSGPGDPAAVEYVTNTVRELVGTMPVVGICLGHQLLCRAVGLETFKLPFGHRGANHPVKDLTTGKIEITSQNHGFAVKGPNGEKTIDGDESLVWDSDFGRTELTHVNLYDRTIEGVSLPEAKAIAVQYHPEAGPGPNDAKHLFGRFVELVES